MTKSDKPPARYDLHLHTFWSYDASAHLQSHFKRADELGVQCIAITEHHSLDSLADVKSCSADYPGVQAIPAAELTVRTSIGDVDLLCYGFPREFGRELQAVLDEYHDWQRDAGAAWSKALHSLECPFSDADRLTLLETYRPSRVLAVQGNTLVNNALLRDHCVDNGFISGAEEYEDLTARVYQQVPFPSYPFVSDVVPILRRAGIKVAIAHPPHYFNGSDKARMDALRQECQLDGIECAHRRVPLRFTAIYRDYCVEHGLFSVGGSDSHTDGDVQAYLGRHGGADEWLDEFLSCLDQ